MTYKIEVTQDDIDNGIMDHCSRCALALAIRRQTPFEVELQNDGQVDVEGRYINLPQEAVEFERKFEDGERHLLKPFTFVLDI
jgi:hypothetical protein